MILYRLRQVERPSDHQEKYGYVEQDGHIYYRNSHTSRGIGVFYLTEASARRALVQINGSWMSYEIVAFEVNEHERT